VPITGGLIAIGLLSLLVLRRNGRHVGSRKAAA
jgi:hypothetical protein